MWQHSTYGNGLYEGAITDGWSVTDGATLNTGGPRERGRSASQQQRGGAPRGMGTQSMSMMTLASAELSGLQLQENPNGYGYKNGPPPPTADGQYLEQEYPPEQYPNEIQPNDNLNAYRIEVQSAALTDLQLTEPNKKDSPLWARPDKLIIKIGGVVSVETFLDTGLGINLAGPKFLEKFGATHACQQDQWMHVGRRMVKVPVYQCVHKLVKV